MNPSKPSRWYKRLAILLFSVIGTLLVLVVAVWGLSPVALRYGLTRLLEKDQVTLTTDSSIRYNPFLSRITITHFGLAKNGQLTTSVDQAVIKIRPSELLAGDLRLTSISLSGFNLDIHQTSEFLEVAGVRVINFGENSSDSGSITFPLGLRVDRFELANSRVLLRTETESHLIDIAGLSFNHLNLNLNHKELAARIDTEIFGGVLSLNFDLNLNKKNYGMIGARARMINMDLAAIKKYLPNLNLDLSGQFSMVANVDFSLSEGSIMLFVSESRLLSSGMKLENDLFALDGAGQRLDLENLTIRFGGDQAVGGDSASVPKDATTDSIVDSIFNQFDLGAENPSRMIALATSKEFNGKRVINIPFSANLSELNLPDSEVTILLKRSNELIRIKSLNLKNLLLGREKQRMTAKLVAAGSAGEVSFDGDLAFSGVNNGLITSKVIAKDLDLSQLKGFLPERLRSISGQASVFSNININFGSDTIRLTAPDVIISPSKARFEQPDFSLRLWDEAFKVEGTELTLQKRKSTSRRIKNDVISADLNISRLSLPNSDLLISTKKFKEKIALAQVDISELRLGRDRGTASILVLGSLLGGDVQAKTDISLNRDGKGTIRLKLDIASLNLAPIKPVLPEKFTQLTGDAGLSGTFNIELADKSVRIEAEDTLLLASNLVLGNDKMTIYAGQQRVPIDQIFIMSRQSGEQDTDISHLEPEATPIASGDRGKTKKAPRKKIEPNVTPKEVTLRQGIEEHLYEVRLPWAQLQNLKVKLADYPEEEAITVTALDLHQIDISNKRTLMNADFRGIILGGSVSISTKMELNANNEGMVESDINLDRMDINRLRPYLTNDFTRLKGIISTDGGLSVQYDKEKVAIQSSGIRIYGSDTDVVKGNTGINGSGQTVTLKDIRFKMDRSASPNSGPRDWSFNSGEMRVYLNQTTARYGSLRFTGENQTLSLKTIGLEGSLYSGGVLITRPRSAEAALLWTLKANDTRLYATRTKLNSPYLEIRGDSQTAGLDKLTISYRQGQSADSSGDTPEMLFKTEGVRLHSSKTNYFSRYLDLGGETQKVDVKGFSAEYSGGKVRRIEADASVEMNNSRLASVYRLNRKYDWRKLSVAKVGFVYPAPESLILVSLNKIAASQLVESAKTSIPNKIQPLADAETVRLKSMSISEKFVLMNDFQIHGLKGNFIIGKDGSIENLLWIDNKPDSEENRTVASRPESGKKEVEDESGPRLAIDKLTIVDSRQVKFINEKLTPADTHDVIISKFELINLDSRSSGMSQLNLAGKIDKYATIDVRGETKFFDDEFDIKLSGHAKEISLPSLMPYIKGTIGSDIEAGQLDAEVTLSVVDSNMDGKAELFLRGLHLEGEGEKGWDPLKQNRAYSLNMILWMLSDDNDNVKLTMPLRGRVDDPNFSLEGLLNVAFEKAFNTGLKTALLGTLIPNAGLLTVTMSLGKKLFKIKFDDLEFAPAAISIDPSQYEYANKFIEIMKKRPDIQVRVCGIATPTDIESAGNFTLNEKERTEKLRQIAQERADALKKFVIEKGQIESWRLLVCAPKIDQKRKAKPRIELDL